MKFLPLFTMILPLVGAMAQQNSCCQTPTFSIDALPLSKPKPGYGNCDLQTSSNSDSARFYINQGLDMCFACNNAESYMAFYRASIFDTSSVFSSTMEFVALKNLGVNDGELYETTKNRAYTLLTREESEMNSFERELANAEIKALFVKEKYRDTLIYNSYKRLYENNPGSPEAAALYIRFLDNGYVNGNPGKNTEMAHVIANKAINKFPESSAVLSAYIVLYEEFQPDNTVLKLAKLIESGPSSGYFVHLSGRIHYHTGQYNKAVESFVESYKIDSVYNADYSYAKSYNWNFVHNLHFLNLALVEAGRYKEAQAWQKVLEKNYLFLQDTEFAGTFAAAMSKVQLPWRLKKWKQCNLNIEFVKSEMIQDSWQAKYVFEALEEYFLARESFHLDKEDSLQIHIKNFEKILKSDKKYAKEGGGDPTEVESKKVMLTVYGDILNFCARYFTEYSDEFDADFNSLDERLTAVSTHNPPIFPGSLHEIAAEILVNHRKYEEALVYLSEAATLHPSSATIQLQLARINIKAGNIEASKNHLEKFHELWLLADKDLLEFEMARMVQVQIDRKSKD